MADGGLAIDNNIAEHPIKSLVIGRKNWRFADSVDVAEANSIKDSLVNTANAKGLDQYKYLYYVLERMPDLKTAKQVETLLPRNAAHVWSETSSDTKIAA